MVLLPSGDCGGVLLKFVFMVLVPRPSGSAEICIYGSGPKWSSAEICIYGSGTKWSSAEIFSYGPGPKWSSAEICIYGPGRKWTFLLKFVFLVLVHVEFCSFFSYGPGPKTKWFC